MKPFLCILCLFMGAFYLNSCAPVYIPNTINVPALSGKGDVSGAFHLSNALEVQGAYAIDSNILVMANYQSYKVDPATITWNSNNTTTTGGSRSNMLEMGAGFYKRIGEKRNGLVEVLGGGGFGISKTVDERFLGHYQKAFVQPSIGFAHKNAQALLSVKPCWVRINNKADLSQTDIKNPASDLFLETALTFRAGIDQVKFNMQLGLALSTQNTFPYEYSPLRISAGIVVILKTIKPESF